MHNSLTSLSQQVQHVQEQELPPLYGKHERMENKVENLEQYQLVHSKFFDFLGQSQENLIQATDSIILNEQHHCPVKLSNTFNGFGVLQSPAVRIFPVSH